MRVNSALYPDGQQILTRHADAEFGREAVVECDEVAPQIRVAALVKVRGERLGRTIARRKRIPCGFAARLTVERGPPLETQIEGVAEQLADPFRLAPLEWRRWCRIGRRRHIWLHHQEHLEKIAVGKPGGERNASTLARHTCDLGGGCFRSAGKHDAAGRN